MGSKISSEQGSLRLRALTVWRRQPSYMTLRRASSCHLLRVTTQLRNLTLCIILRPRVSHNQRSRIRTLKTLPRRHCPKFLSRTSPRSRTFLLMNVAAVLVSALSVNVTTQNLNTENRQHLRASQWMTWRQLKMSRRTPHPRGASQTGTTSS